MDPLRDAISRALDEPMHAYGNDGKVLPPYSEQVLDSRVMEFALFGDVESRSTAELIEQAGRLRSALRTLVDLKDGPRDSPYYERKPKAWAEARAALGREGAIDGLLD